MGHSKEYLKRKTEQENIVLQLRSEKKSIETIAKEIGVSSTTVSRICNNHGVGGSIAPQLYSYDKEAVKAQHDKIRLNIDEVSKRCELKGFEYISGYINTDSMILVKCKVCGNETEKSFISIRHKGKSVCNFCEKEKQDKIKKLRKIEAEKIRKAKREQKLKEKEKADALRNFLLIHQVECKECGRIFVTNKEKVYCSIECRKKSNNRKTDKRFEKFETNVVDFDISVNSLFKRDNGVCWICGEKCNKDDKKAVNGFVVCGNSYPSIDHIIPVSKGGEHSWNNVRLAHRICNSKRFYEENNAPLSFF